MILNFDINKKTKKQTNKSYNYGYVVQLSNKLRQLPITLLLL